jgi:dTDP-4-amino-4,6-dideoxygalactose transaminase
VQLLDLPGLHERIRAQLVAAFAEVLDSGRFVGGERVAAFEHHFAALHGAAGAAGCGSGTDALVLALRAAGVRPGDEVIVPAMTFVATAEAVILVGAVPVFADVDPSTLLLDDASVAANTTSRTRAVVPVHLYGNPVPFDLIRSWRAAGLLVIEDACQAHLASWQGQPVGSAGDAACFSFYPSKNLGALGDGGLVLSNDKDLIARVALLRDHGSKEQYNHSLVGYASRLDALQAAILDLKLPYLSHWNDGRRAAVEAYLVNLQPDDRVSVVTWSEGSAHYLFPIRVSKHVRDIVRAALQARDVSTGLHYPKALTQQPSLRPWVTANCPNAEAAAEELLSLPLDPYMSIAQVDQVCEHLRGALTGASV